MNARMLIAPLMSLVMAGVWLGVQRASIRDLKSETVVLREKIEMARRGWGAGGDQSLAKRMKEQKEEADGEIDWKDLGSKMARSEDGNAADMRVMLELQTMLMTLSGEQLLAELEKIDTLDLSNEVRNDLEGTIAEMLVKKDPKAALDRWIHQVVTVPQTPVIDNGIYQYIRHPNWWAMITELRVVPLFFLRNRVCHDTKRIFQDDLLVLPTTIWILVRIYPVFW